MCGSCGHLLPLGSPVLVLLGPAVCCAEQAAVGCCVGTATQLMRHPSQPPVPAAAAAAAIVNITRMHRLSTTAQKCIAVKYASAAWDATAYACCCTGSVSLRESHRSDHNAHLECWKCTMLPVVQLKLLQCKCCTQWGPPEVLEVHNAACCCIHEGSAPGAQPHVVVPVDLGQRMQQQCMQEACTQDEVSMTT
jgi:hypothetical protein